MDGFERRKTQSRDKIRRAAGRLFNKHGIDRVTITDIAKNAGVSQVTIYNLFGSKDNLVADWITDVADKAIEQLRQISMADKPYFQRIEDIVQAMVGITESNPGLPDPYWQGNAEMRRLEDSFTQQIRDLFLDFVHKGQEEGYCNPRLSDEAVAAYVELLVRGMNANPEIHARTHHDPKLFHDLMLLMLFGFSRTDSANGPAMSKGGLFKTRRAGPRRRDRPSTTTTR